MATYKEKVGTSVVNFAGNYPGAVEGELWYDSTNKDFKYQYLNVTAAGSWRTAGSLNTAREGLGGSGTQTAGLAFGGYTGSVSADTEKYDGSSWTEVNNLNTARTYVAGTGTQTSALAFGGFLDPGNTAITESYNGTSWTEVADLNAARNSIGGAGADNTSVLAMGGSGSLTNTETWNGSSWTEVNDLSTARGALGGGSQGSSNLLNIAFGGSPDVVSTEEWTAPESLSNISVDID